MTKDQAIEVYIRLDTALYALRSALSRAADDPEVQQRLDEAIECVKEVQNSISKSHHVD